MPIPVGEKLAVTLRYLTTGESFKSLMYQFHIHRTTVSLFVLTVVFRNTSFCKELENDQLILPDPAQLPINIGIVRKAAPHFHLCL